MPKVYHFVRRTRHWLDTDDEQHLKLFLYLQNIHSEPIDVTVDWSWAGGGSDPYNIDGVSESKTLQPGEVWQIVKDLLRNPAIDVGQTVVDKIIADVKTIVNSVEYVKEIQFIPTVYRRLPEYQLWNFDDGTTQGWSILNTSYVSVESTYYHSPPYAIRFSDRYGTSVVDSLSRNFNLANVKSATIKYWLRRFGYGYGYWSFKVKDLDTSTVYTIVDQQLVPASWTQYTHDLSDYVNKNIQVIFAFKHTYGEGKWGYQVLDDIELYISY